MNRRCDGVFSEIRPKSSETGLFVHERPGWFRHRCSFSTRTAQPRPCADSLPGLLWLWRSWLSPWLRSFPEWVPYIASAAVTNSFSTLGTVSYDAGSCGVDSTAGVVTSPGIKRIVKVSNNEIYVVGVSSTLQVMRLPTTSPSGTGWLDEVGLHWRHQRQLLHRCQGVG